MPRRYEPEQRAKLVAGFQSARHKGRFAARVGVSDKTLYGWAAKARRPDAPAEPRPRSVAIRRRAPALPPPPTFEIGDWPAVLAAYECVRAALAQVSPAVADAVLRTHLYRLHIPGLNVPPAAGAEREGAAE